MTEIATIDWFGRWGTSVFPEIPAIYFICCHGNWKSKIMNKAFTAVHWCEPLWPMGLWFFNFSWILYPFKRILLISSKLQPLVTAEWNSSGETTWSALLIDWGSVFYRWSKMFKVVVFSLHCMFEFCWPLVWFCLHVGSIKSLEFSSWRLLWLFSW